MTVLYQLSAHGVTRFMENSGQIISKRVFATREEAEQFIPEFRNFVTKEISPCDPSALIDDKNLRIAIHELEMT